LPESDRYAKHVTLSSVAVFITDRPDSSGEDSVREINFLIINGIEGLDFDKISLALFPVTPPPLPKALKQTNIMFSFEEVDMIDGSKMHFFMLINATLALILVLILLNIFVLLSDTRKKKEKEARTANLSGASNMALTTTTAADENKEELRD
jgi:type III secretion protein J